MANRFSDDVSVIDTSTDAVVATVAVGDLPAGVAVSPDGSRVYVSNFVDNTVSVIDTSTNTVVATVPVGAGPNSPAVTPDGTRLYVPNGSSDNVSVVNATTNSVAATVPVGDDPRNLAITPDGTRAYVSNVGSTNLSVLDTDPASPTFHTVVATVDMATSARGLAITPDGARAYVAVGVGIFPNPDQVKVLDTDPASPTFQTVLATIAVESNPWGVAITPDGARVYVVNNGSNTVSVISTATDTVTATLTNVGGDPQGIAITSDGGKAFVASTFDTAKVIDTNPSSAGFHTVIATVSLGDGPAGIAMAPSRADLSVTKMDSPDPVSALSSLTYTMIVTNNGPQEATGVTLTDTLPEDLGSTSIAPTQGSCEEAGGTVSCDLGALPAGASATVTIVAAPQSEGVIENTVSVTANEVDADTLNNSATAGTTVDPTSPPLPIPGVTLWGIIAMVGLIAAVLFWRLSGIRAGAGPRGVQG